MQSYSHPFDHHILYQPANSDNNTLKIILPVVEKTLNKTGDKIGCHLIVIWRKIHILSL